MAEKKKPKQESMRLGRQHVSKPGKPWEAQELSDINRNWVRPYGTREHARQMSVQRTKDTDGSRRQPRRSTRT